MASVNKREWTTPKGEQRSAWEVRYLLSGRHKSKSFARKKDADTFKRKIEDGLASGDVHTLDGTVTVKRMCDEWIKENEDRVEAKQIGLSSMSNLRRSVDLHLIPNVGKLKVSDLRAAHVEDLFRTLMKSHKLSPRTARSHVFYLRQACEFGRRRGYLRSDPITPALKLMRGLKMPKVRTFTTEQVRDLLKAAEDRAFWQHPITFLRLKCFVHLAAFCGLRYGEIVGLTLDSLDFDEGMIRVRTALSRFDELKGPKTEAGVRDVPMPVHLSALLSRWLSHYFVENERNLVFRTDTGLQIRPSNFHGAHWRPLLRRAGLDDGKGSFHFHALRHFASSWWIANGMDLPTVASLMGHSKFDMTLQVYAHPVLPVVRHAEVMGRLADRLLDVPALSETAAAVALGSAICATVATPEINP